MGFMGIGALKRVRVCGAVCGLIVLAWVYCGQSRRTFASEPEHVGLPWDWSHEHVNLSADRSHRNLAFSASTSLIQRLQLSGYALAQSPEAQAPASRISLPDDWSHRHLIFSYPGTFQDAINHGTLEQWLRIVNDPRYIMQKLKREASARRQAASAVAETKAGHTEDAALTGGPSLWQVLRKAWRTRNRKTSIQLLALQLAIVIFLLSFAVAFFRQRRWAPKLMPVLSAAVFLFLSSCGGDKTSGSTDTSGPSINDDWSMLPGASAVGVAGVYPAKYSFSLATASCSDFVVFPSAVAGSSTVPSIVAYTNLYSGCANISPNNPAPNVQWAVNLDGGTVATSPVLSLDGTQVAFVTTIGGVANLVVLDMPTPSLIGVTVSQVTSKSTSPGVNSSTPCTAPCADWVAFSAGNGDTVSSPFLDYGNNVAYVGDSKGVLHKFINVFHGYLSGTNTAEPSELVGGTASSGWPQTITFGGMCTNGSPLSSPVYDSGSQNVFVGVDGANCGIARIPSGGGSSNIVVSAQLNKANSSYSFSIVVDSTTKEVYVFTAHAQPKTPVDTAGVAQLPAAFTSGATPTWAFAGNGGVAGLDTYIMYVGDFDNNYYTGASNPNLYVCAVTESTSSPSTIVPTVFRISMTGTFGASVSTGPVVGTTTAGNCSPVTEFFNGTNDYVFLSQAGANVTASPISCASGTGCIMSFDVTNGTQTFNSSAPATHATRQETSGTGGIIPDNDASSPTGASNVYFSVLGSQSCARTVTGGDINGSATITAIVGIFTAGDVGAAITGTGVPASTTISSVTNSTTAVMSQNASGTNSGVTFSITDTGGCAIQASQSSFSQ